MGDGRDYTPQPLRDCVREKSGSADCYLDIRAFLFTFTGMVKTSISSKGQTTIPSIFRKKWRTTEVLWEGNPDGSAVVRPVPDIMTLLGSAGDGRPRDPREMEKARDAIADDVKNRGTTR